MAVLPQQPQAAQQEITLNLDHLPLLLAAVVVEQKTMLVKLVVLAVVVVVVHQQALVEAQLQDRVLQVVLDMHQVAINKAAAVVVLGQLDRQVLALVQVHHNQVVMVALAQQVHLLI